jgi:MFS family permease
LVAASLALSAVSTEVWHLVGARAVGGVGVGLFTAAASGMLVRLDSARSGELLGRLSAFELAGISLGPLGAALGLAVADPQATFAVSACVVAAGAVVVGLLFRDAAPQRITDSARPPIIAFDLLRSRFVVGAVVLQFAVMVPVGAYDAIWPRFMADIGAGPLLTAASYTVFAIPYVIVAGWAGRLADRLGGATAYARGVLVLIVTISLYAVLPNPWIATGLGLVESSGQAFAFIGAAAAMAHAVVPARASSAQGLLRASGLIAATVASALSGVVYADLGALTLFWGTAGTVLVVSIAGLMLLRGSQRARGRPESAGAVPVTSRAVP